MAENEEKKGSGATSASKTPEHSVGGVTTKDDAHDVGVEMLPGDPAEPQGPEDALGKGAKRGDYRDRILTNPHTSEVIPEDEREENGPTSRIVPQAPRAEDIGDEAGEKGGVTTS